MKKIFITIGVLILLIIPTACLKQNISDSVKFKKEYEELNDKQNKEGINYRNIKINQKNPFIYSNTKEISNMIDNKETFYVYFADRKYAYVRSTIEKLIEVADKQKIKKIYYVNLWTNESYAVPNCEECDEYMVYENNQVTKTKEGTDDYHNLVSKLSNVLSNYSIQTADGFFEINEKAIYPGDLIYVENGEAITSTDGISDQQIDPYGELTDQILMDEEIFFKDIFDR